LREADGLDKVNPPGSIFSGNIGPLEVDSETHFLKKRIIFKSLCQDFQLANYPLMGGSDESGKKAYDTCRGQREGCLMKPFRSKARAIEIHPCKPIHLGIKKT
jgi:hypothetical protein